MAHSDPYEEWKAQGRQGSFADWGKAQEAPAAPAPAPAPAAPSQPSQPRQSGGGANPYSTNPYTGQGNQAGYPDYQNYDNYKPPQAGYQTSANPRGQPQQQAAPAGEDYNSWFARGNAAGGGKWDPNSAETKAAYQAHLYTLKNPGQGGGMGENAEYAGSGDPTGMRAYAAQNRMSEDYKRFSNATLASWESQKSPNCPPNTPYMAFDGTGCVEKPIDSAPGMGKWSKGGAGGGGGKGGKGGGGGGVGGVGGNLSDQDLALYKVKTQYADALADPTGQKAWELYSGAGGEKTFQEEIDRNRQLIAGMPEGPARQAAIQRLNEQEMSMRMALPKSARNAAIQGLTGVIQPELGYVASERDRQLNELLGKGNLANQRYGMNLNYNLGSRGLDLSSQNQAWQQNTYFPWQTGQAAAELANSRYPYEMQQQQGQAGGLGSAFGEMLGQVGQYALSDIRAKENITPGRRGLSDLLKLRQYGYNYKGKSERTQSVMAQDLEKVAPEMVKEFDGVKHVDTYGLLGMTMKAVQDLAKKMEDK